MLIGLSPPLIHNTSNDIDMAILQKWKVTIETEGKAVQELKATTEGHRQPADVVTKYIEVKSCTNFAVRIIAPKAFKLHGNAVVADISLDGVCYDRRLFDKYTKKGARTALIARNKVVVGQELAPSDGSGRLRPFEFAVLRGKSKSIRETRTSRILSTARY